MSIHWGMSTILAIHWMVCFLSSQSGIAANVDRLLAPNTTWLLPSEPFPSTWCEPRLKIPGTTAHTPGAPALQVMPMGAAVAGGRTTAHEVETDRPCGCCSECQLGRASWSS